MQPRTTDPITLELIKNALQSIVDEMALTVVRTAHSGVIKDVMDFSTGFCNPDGEMVAQGLTLPLHLGSIPDAIAAVLRKYGQNFAPGDIIIMNDPFEGGMHLPDIFMFKPLFRNDELIGFPAVVCHHTDVGGRVAGSNASDSTEIYQEGLRIPPLKLYEAGVPNETLFTLIEKNVRVPLKVLGDLRAQLAACHIAEREYLRLVDRYGLKELNGYLEELLNYTERLARAEIAAMPDGEYGFEDHIDNDGIDPDPILLKVKVTVHGDSMTVDFSGTSPQVKGAINSTFSFTKSAVYLSTRCIMDGHIPNNAGFFRPLQIYAPEGTIVNPVLPAACAARGLTGFRLGDLMMGALAQIAPHKVCAAGEGGNTGISIGGYDSKRNPFIFVEFVCGSWGGRYDKDGIEGITNWCENLCNTPVEVVEAEHPVRIEQYGYVPDTGGAGKFRGGLSLIRDYRLLEKEAVLQVRSDRRLFLPYGLQGGKPGTPSLNILNPEGENKILPTQFTMTMKQGDLLRHIMPGGGGYGAPWEREIERILEDIRNEKITPAYAQREYGVVVDPVSLVVDEVATGKLRQKMRQEALSS